MIVAGVLLGTMLLISWGCWAYLGFNAIISGLVGLVRGLGLGIFGFLMAICELEKSEEQSGFGLE